MGVRKLSVSTLFKKDLPDRVASSYRVAKPLLQFLADALGVPF